MIEIVVQIGFALRLVLISDLSLENVESEFEQLAFASQAFASRPFGRVAYKCARALPISSSSKSSGAIETTPRMA